MKNISLIRHFAISSKVNLFFNGKIMILAEKNATKMHELNKLKPNNWKERNAVKINSKISEAYTLPSIQFSSIQLFPIFFNYFYKHF